jgi:hypothetical protein
MIVSLVLGGLGNQMFQYALGRQLSSAQHTTLKLATFGYRLRKYRRHPYLLDRFNIRAQPAGVGDYLRLAPQACRLSALTLERGGGFDRRILRLERSTLLVGYWQSPRYFPDVAAELREELTLREAPSAATRDMAARIAATTSVAVHVRRTDYIANPDNVELFEECTLDYYQAAMRLMTQRLGAPHFFVFSDDPAWARAHLRSDAALTYVEHNDAAHGHEDLMLMRQCRHNVIANSTFSWWGAWLDDRPDKLVVAPRRWFKGGGGGREDDLLPDAWIRI